MLKIKKKLQINTIKLNKENKKYLAFTLNISNEQLKNIIKDIEEKAQNKIISFIINNYSITFNLSNNLRALLNTKDFTFKIKNRVKTI